MNVNISRPNEFKFSEVHGAITALLKFFIKNKEHTFSYRVSRETKKINSAYDQASLAIFTLTDTGELSSIKCSMHKTLKNVFLFYDNRDTVLKVVFLFSKDFTSSQQLMSYRMSALILFRKIEEAQMELMAHGLHGD